MLTSQGKYSQIQVEIINEKHEYINNSRICKKRAKVLQTCANFGRPKMK